MVYSWDDIRVFLALLSERTTGRAAALLGCSQPTVVRRIAALEGAIGLSLFDRTPTGFVPTDAAMALRDAARMFERADCELVTEAGAQRGEDSPVVRLTLLDHFEKLVVPVLRKFRQDWPSQRVEILATDRIFDLTRGEADIAIRGRAASEEDVIVCRQLPNCAWAVYASAENLASECPKDWPDLENHVLALPEGAPALLPIYRDLAEIAAVGSKSLRCSNYNSIRSAIVSGNAISALPVTLGETDPELKRCLAPRPDHEVPIYLLARRTALRKPPIRKLFDAIYVHFSEQPELLLGRPHDDSPGIASDDGGGA